MMTIRTLILLHILVISSLAHAGQGTLTGKELQSWDTGELSLVVGVLKDAKEDGAKQSDRYAATLVPLATLGGTFDPSLHPKLAVRFYVGGPTSSIGQVPPDGAMVIAVIVVGTMHGREEKPSNWILSDICTFMPGNSALVAIKGLGDPKLLETIKKFQDARNHPDLDPDIKKDPVPDAPAPKNP